MPVASRARVLIVEDEAIIARDIERQLLKAGYEVAGTADSAQSAFEQVASAAPDLILMDIRLKGPVDGIEAARKIGEEYRLPIIYLTAHADEHTLARAKVTEPFGYIVKPIGNGNLTASIEMALYKHRVERQLEQHRALLNTILRTIPEAVIVADASGRVQFMNSAAEQLTGWTAAGFAGELVTEVLPLETPGRGNATRGLLDAALANDKPVMLPRETRLQARAGAAVEVDGHVAVSHGTDGAAGFLLTLHDATARQKEERQIRQEQATLAVGQLARDVANDFYSLFDLLSDCALEVKEGLRESSPLREPAEIIRRAAETASIMTRQLLALGSSKTVGAEPVDLNRMLDNSAAFFERLCGRTVHFEMKLAQDPVAVFSHPAHLDQLALNLVLYAKDQILGNGNVLLTTELVAGSGPQARPGGRVRIAVTTEQTAAQATSGGPANFSLENPALNLTIVNALVTAAEGSVHVYDEQDGVCVTEVLLPVSTDVPGVPAVGGTRNGATVLTAGLNLETALVLHARLEENGFFVLEAANAQEALLVSDLYQREIDLVIADDTRIPPRAQHQLYEVIGAQRPGTRFLCLASQTGGGPAHAFQVLWKPFQMPELVNSALDLVRERDAFHAGQ